VAAVAVKPMKTALGSSAFIASCRSPLCLRGNIIEQNNFPLRLRKTPIRRLEVEGQRFQSASPPSFNMFK
jgi:hypothetical protein